MKLKNKTAIVTGASRGIGKAIALELAKEGCNILINYARNEEAARKTEDEIKQYGVQTYISKADVSNYEEVNQMMNDAISHFGKIDILVNNAGISRPNLLKRMTTQEWQSVISTNLTGIFNCSRLIINHMIDNDQGIIINMSSLYGQTGSFGQCNYSAAKWGVIGFTKSLALEVARHNIRVNAIAPGAIDTDMIKGLKEEIKDELIKSTPMRRPGNPEEVAKLALFLVTDATYTTGEVVAINGGFRV